MILLFTSNSENKYKRDALAALALPRGSILRFRYDAKYVCPSVRDSGFGSDGTVRLSGSVDALLIYAQADSSDRTKHFAFFPLRLGRVVRVQKVGLAYYADVELCGYPDLSGEPSSTTALDTIRDCITRAPAAYPLPAPPSTGKGMAWADGEPQPQLLDYYGSSAENRGHAGYFFDRRTTFAEILTADDDSSGWQAVVIVLGMSDLKDAAFFRVAGFFRVARRWRRFIDSRIAPAPRWPEVEYVFPMGNHAVMTVESLRPETSSLKAFRLVIETGGDSLAAVEPQQLLFESRYDQNRVVIASRRVLDAVMTTLSITCQSIDGDQALFSPSLAFIIRVRPSRWITLLAPLAAASAALLLSVSPDFVAGIGDLMRSQTTYAGAGSLLVAAKAEIAVTAKALAVVLSVCAAWLVFRKAPTGK